MIGIETSIINFSLEPNPKYQRGRITTKVKRNTAARLKAILLKMNFFI